MPYRNDLVKPDHSYEATGWINSGLSSAGKITVNRFDPKYETHNRVTITFGAVVLSGIFYIHSGPADFVEAGWASAGCVQIFGSFDLFKNAISNLTGAGKKEPDKAISTLIQQAKLTVINQATTVPDR